MNPPSIFASRWYESRGKESDVVISSRVRLARNLVDFPFPGRMSREEELHVTQRVMDAVARSRHLQDLVCVDLSSVDVLERRSFVEEGLISQSYSLEAFRSFALKADASMVLCPNDIEHLRVSAFAPGLDLDSPYQRLLQYDQALEDSLNYAANFELGYICTELNSMGTGLRASLLLHLPALSDSGLIEKAMKAVLQQGLSVRGFYGGEGQSSGALYQISNALSIGLCETDILARVVEQAKQLVHYERLAREELAEKDRDRLSDQVYRAYAILSHARILSIGECFELLSRIRLGLALGWLSGIDLESLNALYYRCQKAGLQRELGYSDDSDRGIAFDALRAKKLKTVMAACRLNEV